jgi:hypothetical protein
VAPALEWLAEQQRPDGSWDGSPRKTGLALLAFLAGAHTHKHGRHRRAVKEGLKYLKIVQGPKGWFGPPGENEEIYDHLLATLAMTEAYGLTLSPLFKASAMKGVDVVRSWLDPPAYGIYPEDRAPAVIAWSALVLKAADLAGLKIGPEDLARCAACFDGRGPGVDPGFLVRTPSSRDAAEVVTRIFAAEKPGKSALLDAAVARLREAGPPDWAEGGGTDLGAWWFGALASFQADPRSWETWSAALGSRVVPRQAPDGKWDAGDGSGRIASTALLTGLVTMRPVRVTVIGVR